MLKRLGANVTKIKSQYMHNYWTYNSKKTKDKMKKVYRIHENYKKIIEDLCWRAAG